MKVAKIVGLVADFGPGAALVVAGLTMLVGGLTGALWT